MKKLLCLALASVAWANGYATAALDSLSRPGTASVRVGRALITSVVSAERRLVACGERGIVLLSDDDGQHWRQASAVPISVTLSRMFFTDAKTGWAVGHSGVVLGTNDGGDHWRLLLDGKRAAALESAAAQAEGNPTRQANAERLVQDGADKPFFGLHFTDTKHGLVVGAYGIAFVTEDGGQTWQSAMDRIPNPKNHHLYALHREGTDLYIAGEQGNLYRSGDGGKSYTSVDTGAKGTLFGLVSGKGVLLAYGLRGALYRSDGDGKRWDKVELPPITITAGQRLKDGSYLLADEAGHLLHSTDGGKSFRPLPQARSAPVVSLTQAEDGQLILAGIRNLSRLALDTPPTERQK